MTLWIMLTAALAFIIAAKALARHQRFGQEPRFRRVFPGGHPDQPAECRGAAEGLRAV
jgi:hypothetical protein